MKTPYECCERCGMWPYCGYPRHHVPKEGCVNAYKLGEIEFDDCEMRDTVSKELADFVHRKRQP